MDILDKKGLQAIQSVKIKVIGRVQGVGFRPFVYQIAMKNQIKGTVQNNLDGVFIHAEASQSCLHQFIYDLKHHAPRLSKIDRIIIRDSKVKQCVDFTIIPSNKKGDSTVIIPIDSAICGSCVIELTDPKNHRYNYPFITCTQCGPRYTIIEDLPYDRPLTSMKTFEMCPTCKSEYKDPINRRHHAEPIACSTCGPYVSLYSIDGEKLTEREHALKRTIDILKSGKIVAVKGIGGYHLICNATNEKAVQILRKRKNRPTRPLAIMAKNLSDIELIAHVSKQEETELAAPEAPIVIVRKKQVEKLAKSVAPGLATVGVLLPYTPLHHILFKGNVLDYLVVTSANLSGMPILYKDNEAFLYLDGIADYILTHNRNIIHPLDDSVVQFINGEKQLIRRSRGFVPEPIELKVNVNGIIALGAIQKNVFGIGKKNQIYLSPHIGDLRNVEVERFADKEYEHFIKMLGVKEKTLVVDLHPNFPDLTTGFNKTASILKVQHHHAHMVSCMADNQLFDSCFGIVLDGTGYGLDGNIWGFEVFYGNASSVDRIAHANYTPLPGGEKAIQEPWRNAVGMLVHYFGSNGKKMAKHLFKNKEKEIDILATMVKLGVNSPLAGTCGRLFDAVSAMLGVCTTSTYDGEAAVTLSDHLQRFQGNPYSFDLIKTEDSWIINFSKMIMEIFQDHMNGVSVEQIIYRFHVTISQSCVDVVKERINISLQYNRSVVLSGGSFLNSFLVEDISAKLSQIGCQVYTHQHVSCNDSGLALGQIIIAANQLNGKGD
ncbi:carbamoyltransferase HypF [Metabacillus halosaccharovorans]|uniref:carbamoyltransferase HypF n=1 Tax=Metabacillus halosaccharovorans TaxID=930124 RepID=UPI0037359F07